MIHTLPVHDRQLAKKCHNPEACKVTLAPSMMALLIEEGADPETATTEHTEMRRSCWNCSHLRRIPASSGFPPEPGEDSCTKGIWDGEPEGFDYCTLHKFINRSGVLPFDEDEEELPF